MAVVSRKVLTPFYGYPAELIASWCGVSLDAARRYKAGKRRPSKQVMKLFALHRDGLVLDERWRGWSIRDGAIFDPEGNATTEAQLRAYWIVMQYAAELARQNPAEQERWYALLRRA